MKTRSYVSSRARALRSAASASPSAHLARRLGRARATRGWPAARAHGGGVALDEHGAARRPRESASMPSAPRARRTGRARARPRRRRASRTAPRARGRRSAASPARAAPAGACRRASRRSPARTPPRDTGAADLASAQRDRLERLGRRSAAQRVAEQRVLGRAAARGRAATIASACARARSSSSASSGRRATRNWPRPDWRVPISSPSLRSSRSISASGSRRRARPARAAAREPGGPDEQAAARVLAAADAPAQLVQLGDPEALGVLDQHHGRVGHVDPDLDHRRRDEHVGLARRERRHRLLLLARAHPAVQQHQPIALRSSPSRRRSSSAVAARAPIPAAAAPARSPPVTPRPAGRRRTPGARPRAPRGAARRRAARSRSPATMRVSIGWRPRGSSRSALMSRSP